MKIEALTEHYQTRRKTALNRVPVEPEKFARLPPCPSPEQAKTRTMPADDRLRFDDHQGLQGGLSGALGGRFNAMELDGDTKAN